MIRGGRVVTPDGVAEVDVAIAGGQITAIGAKLGDSPRVIDACGKWVMPGGIDAHAHIEQRSGQGLWNADTFETATRSAAFGGTTSVICFAAQGAGQSLQATVKDYDARAKRGAMIDYAYHIIISDPAVPAFEPELAALIEAGHRSLKVFTTYQIKLDDAEILKVFKGARQHGALVCVHAETDALIEQARGALLVAGRTHPKYHALSHPRMAEIEAVERMCRFAEYLGQPVMLFHISTAEGAAAIKAAQTRGAPVWGETCPHYLFMTDAVLDRPGVEGAKWMCSPPQRKTADQEALWAALDEGVLSLISSDHAPYRFDETGKLSAGPEAGFHEIANGLPGLETRLPLIFDAMVSQGRGGPEAFAEVTAAAPARIYGLTQKGEIAVGKDADLVIWDADAQVTYSADDLHDNVGYNPWVGRTVTGWPEHVLLRGETLVQSGTFHGKPGQGRWIDRTALAVPTSEPLAEAL